MAEASRAARLAAASFEAAETEILDRYSRELDAAGLLGDERRAGVLAAARTVLAECAAVLASAEPPTAEPPTAEPAARRPEFLGRMLVAGGMDPRESVHAAHKLAGVLTAALIDVLRPEGGALLGQVLARMYEIIAGWTMSAVALAESRAVEGLQEGVHRERTELAREIHDEIGSILALALRNLDLHDYYEETGKAPLAVEKAAVVRRVLLDGVQSSRRLVRDLREPVQLPGLGVALETLVRYIDNPGVAVEIVVTGDESLVPDTVRYQVFTMVRECVRNSFAYSGSDSIRILIAISETEICAVVEDAGAGFGAVPSGDGFGLRSVEERAELHHGRFLLSARPGSGTRAEIVVPLAGNGGDGG